MIESQVEHWILSHAGDEIPVAIELLSGRRIEMGRNPTVTIRLKSLAALRTPAKKSRSPSSCRAAGASRWVRSPRSRCA